MTQHGMWVIGYGSLIFKPPPLVAFRVSGTIQGYLRRFWQSSSDHRGTPENPGRVATLVSLEDLQQYPPFNNSIHTYELQNSTENSIGLKKETQDVSEFVDHDLKVWGVAYYIEPENVEEVRQYLDIREQDGYTLHTIEFHVHTMPENDENAHSVLSKLPRAEDGDLYIQSSVYIGTIDNPSFVGPESIEGTAKVIRNSRGPSGENFSYLDQLTKAVRALHPDQLSKDAYLDALTHLSTPS